MNYRFRIGGQDFAVEVERQSPATLRVSVNGNLFDVSVIPEAAPAPERETAIGTGGGLPTAQPVTPEAFSGEVLAPIPGLILEVRVRVGDSVRAGQAVAVMEAMKMENNLLTNVSGVVTEILVQKGSEVATGDVILRIDAQG